MMPKRGCDVTTCEIARFFRLNNSGLCQVSISNLIYWVFLCMFIHTKVFGLDFSLLFLSFLGDIDDCAEKIGTFPRRPLSRHNR